MDHFLILWTGRVCIVLLGLFLFWVCCLMLGQLKIDFYRPCKQWLEDEQTHRRVLVWRDFYAAFHPDEKDIQGGTACPKERAIQEALASLNTSGQGVERDLLSKSIFAPRPRRARATIQGCL